MNLVARALASIALLFVGTSAFATGARADFDMQTADGMRHAIVVRTGDGPKPTVIVLHGALGTGAFLLRTSGFAEAAERLDFNAVFPDGVDRQWTDGRVGGHKGPDDVAYLRALVDRLIADHVARPDRIYLAGISNGGMMSLTMACKAGALFAGVGTIIANLPLGIEPCAFTPMPVVMINGTADPIVPYQGGSVGFSGERGTVLSVDQTIASFAKADGCNVEPESQPIAKKDPNTKTSATKLAWQGCKPGTSLTQYRVDGGGHGVPGRAVRGVDLLGAVNLDFVAADVIMEAFDQP
jgi:polyhydroxybutyrate depolymerase